MGHLTSRLNYLFTKQRGLCAYCGERMNRQENHPKAASVDHIVPWCLGGKNLPHNSIACCRDCNSIKGGYDLVDFFTIITRTKAQREEERKG